MRPRLLAALLVLPACASPAARPLPPAPAEKAMAAPAAVGDYAVLDSAPLKVPVLFGTNRAPDDSSRTDRWFGTRDADTLRTGLAVVNVPSYRYRIQGELAAPPAWRANRFWFSPDAERDMYITAIRVLDSAGFAARLTTLWPAERGETGLLFVHGYNVSFQEATLRAAQLAADLSIAGPVLLFSWPSRGTLLGYTADRAEATYSARYLAEFLRRVEIARPGQPLNLLVHSMGSEVLSRAVELLERDENPVRYGQVALLAPDVDARLFRRDILPILDRRADRVTVYSSDADEALRASRVLNGVWRLGLGGDSLVVGRGFDTIDATQVRTDLLGHSSFPSVDLLNDLYLLVARGITPEARRLLRASLGGLTFWRLRPGG
jgi:esterase/lipase superfamily enzyme